MDIHQPLDAAPNLSSGTGSSSWWLSVCACGLIVSTTAAEVSTSPPPATPAAPAKSTPLPPPPPPPLPPPPRNPVDTLRQLLAMNAAERAAALERKPAKQREYLEQRLRDFDALTPAARELQLRSLQLRYYLLPVLKAAPANRAAQLRVIPAEDRKVIEARLEEWDRLPASHQRELLQNENTLRCFPRFETNSPAQQAAALAGVSPERRQQVEEDLVRWRAYTPAQRERMYDHFQQFFALSARQKEKTLKVLPEAERQRMLLTLRAFEKLPSEQRARCIAAFQKFSAMSSADRARFLQNAARWEAMTDAERDAWRDLMARMPPLPPGLGAPPMPPMPPAPNRLTTLPQTTAVSNAQPAQP
jgi:hypothetical protein